MASNIKSPKQALNPAFASKKPEGKEIERFKKEFINLLNNIKNTENKETEEHYKIDVMNFLNSVYYKDKHYINTKGKNDLVIHNSNDVTSSVGVLIEAKSPVNKSEMVSVNNLNVKSFQELVLYYLRERKTGKNFELRYLIITNIYEWFVFDAQDFEKLFYQNKVLLNRFEQFREGKLSGTSTNFFYKEIASPEIQTLQNEIPYTHFDIREYEEIIRNANEEDDKKLIALYKFLSPTHLLKLSSTIDNNHLNKEFYAELLHIIGLEEITRDNRKLIVRKKEKDRDSGSLIENTIERIDIMGKWDNLPTEMQNTPSLQFDVALDLAITWINRILFLKLLESQILKYHNGNKDYSFLSSDKLNDYNDLLTLFFSVLAKKEDERSANIKSKFVHVPYLNSSLFDMTEIEDKTINIDSLQNNIQMVLYSKSVLYGQDKSIPHTMKMRPLEYLLRFLDAYDFSSEGSKDHLGRDKSLISASVLGLIFEKINGYKDGSFFTPSFITMYMCRETIGRAVIQKFNEVKGWNCQTINELYNKIENIDEANEIFNTLRICDPAVGSGHFLVSALNEMIFLKSELGILTDKKGKKLRDYSVIVEKDELIITDNENTYFTYNPKNTESQRVQETFFKEKQTIIENCLFGVDINPNSVKICQLRLWIELLKHTYYHWGTSELETLPNIDI
ncbi:MAG: class I SAM-dependent DNA methyltransferase, partial [Candidatus Azobacteroides sp.]|nr:class I SAM-dependent DNA methyltransferase [Candidatus Azobacteroides sp.]